jgi:hypothetical protein
MKISKIGNVFVDWMKATHRFGFTFTNYLAARTEMSPKAAKFGGGALDVLAGGFFTYSAVTSAIGAIASAVAAVSAFAVAPLAAVGTIAIGVVWLALSCLTVSTGLGFLGAAREKAGIPPLSSFFRGVKSAVNKGAEKVAKPFKKAFKADAKITRKFKDAANNNQPPAPANPSIKSAPRLKY